MDIDTRYINQLEVIATIFTVDKGEIKVLLFRRTEEPFKGYWYLPSNLLMTTETIENCCSDTIFEFAGLENLYIEQCNIFSKINRLPSDRIIANSLIAVVDSITLEIKRHKRKGIESQWFDIESIPKMVYDHGEILEDAIKYFKKRVIEHDMLIRFFPSDFTLPEIQHIYEQSLGKTLDRRNFRKKMIALDILEDTGYKNNKNNGRPAKLYRFKDNEAIGQF